MKYLIITKEKKTYISQEDEIKALIYTDFVQKRDSKNISLEDIVDAETKKKIAQISLFKDDIINVYTKWKNLASLEDGEYKQDKKVITYRESTKAMLENKEEYEDIENLTRAYFLDNGVQIFCFEKDGELGAWVYTNDEDLTSVLKTLPLVLKKRVEVQDYVFEMMKD
jgi:hypothetical protein